MNGLLKTLITACFAAGAAIGVQAAPIVTQWTATNTASFSSATYTAGGTTTPSLLSWGTSTGQGQSSLAITNPASDVVVDTYIGGGSPPPAYIAAGSTLTHTNNPVTGSSLTGATLSDTLTLSALTPPGTGPGTLPPINFNIAFDETPNSGTCAATSPPGNPCNDIFVLLGGFFNQTFNYDGQDYFVNIFPTMGGALSILDDSTCAAVHAVNSAAPASGCFGFTTPEGAATRLAFGFTISTNELSLVPEPGSLAIVGIALFGLGAVRVRARKQN